MGSGVLSRICSPACCRKSRRAILRLPKWARCPKLLSRCSPVPVHSSRVRATNRWGNLPRHLIARARREKRRAATGRMMLQPSPAKTPPNLPARRWRRARPRKLLRSVRRHRRFPTPQNFQRHELRRQAQRLHHVAVCAGRTKAIASAQPHGSNSLAAYQFRPTAGLKTALNVGQNRRSARK